MKFKTVFCSLAVILLFFQLHASWELQHSDGFDLNDVDFPPNNTNIGYAVGNNSYYMKTTDGGRNWDTLTIIPSGNFYDVDFPVNELTGYIACDEGNVLKTTDGGEIWESFNVGLDFSLYAIHFPNNNDTGYVVGQEGTVRITRDGGSTWEESMLPVPTNLNDIYFINSMQGWVAGNEGFVFYTPNGGAEWIERPTGVSENLFGVFFFDELVGWVVGFNGTFFETTNGGEQWELIGSPFPLGVDINSVIFPVDTSNGFVCGTKGNVARTTNGGRSWETASLDSNHHLTKVEFPSDNEIGWVCGSRGAVYKTTDGGIWVQENNLNPELATNSINCIPNPFRTNLTIKAPYPENSQANLRIFDCTGSIVRTIALDKKGIVNWNGRNELNQRVSPGVYLIELKNRNSTSHHLKVTVLE